MPEDLGEETPDTGSGVDARLARHGGLSLLKTRSGTGKKCPATRPENQSHEG
jgi:hypothetical protein